MAKVRFEGTFRSESFAEGRFRKAYKGTWTYPPDRAGGQMVVKKMKDTYVFEPTRWDMTFKIHETSADLAVKFMSEVRPARSIGFANVERAIVTEGNPNTSPKLNEYVTVEEYLPGDFIKWCSNNGYIKRIATGEHNLLPASMHWTWAHTKGEMMVSDVQGVFSDGGYRLTDPAIMSLDGKFGPTDTSVMGLILFFASHQCSHIACRGLATPTSLQVAGVIPDDVMKGINQIVREIGRSTTYSTELYIPPDICAKAKVLLRKVGQRQL